MDQHRLEREIRAMLRRARRPEDLEEIPLVRDLCTALGISNASLMLRELADAAFTETPGDTKLRKLIFDCDLNGITTQEGAALEFNVSRRQFHRLRTQAVRVIAKQVARILVNTGEDSPRDDIEQLARSLATSSPEVASQIFSLASSTAVATRMHELRARLESGAFLEESDAASFPPATRPAALVLVAQSRFLNGAGAPAIDAILQEIEELMSRSGRGYDDLTRYELEYLNFLRAKAASDGVAMRSSARSLERLSGDRKPLQCRAIAAAADAALRCGDIDEARRLTVLLQAHSSTAHDVRHLANASLLNGQISYVEGSYHKAQVAARAARLALAQHYPDVLRTEILLGRIALAADTIWEPGDLIEQSRGESLERCAIGLIYARYLLRRQDTTRARFYATEAYDRTQRGAYEGLAVLALATLGAIEDLSGNEEQAQIFYDDALMEFAEVCDALLGSDAFTIPGVPERRFGPLASVNSLIEPLLLRIRRVVPDLPFAGNTMEAWRGFFQVLLSDANAHELERASSDPAISRIVTRHGTAISEALTAFAAPVLPRHQRIAFVARVRETLRRIAAGAISNVPTIARAHGTAQPCLEA